MRVEDIDKDELNKSWVTDGLIRIPEGLTEDQKKEAADKINIVVGATYEKVIEVLRTYVDLREEYYPLIATWIFGTYVHNKFNTYPYLFINAMRGSGKTKLLKLIAALSNNGEVISSLKEAVLFRDCKGKTICIDEFEGVMRKENQAVRELLNAGYKKGSKVKRLKKVRNRLGEDYEVEEFDIYTPLCIANIWGMEEVLADRCITLVLEKSNNKKILKLLEDFDGNEDILECKKVIQNNLVQLCSYFGVFRYITKWNTYIHSTYNTYTTLTTLITPQQGNLEKLGVVELDIFNKINNTEINGRNLELMFPLFLIARAIGKEPFENMLSIAKTITSERRSDEMTESRDVSLIDFISQQISSEFIPVKILTHQFREFIGEGEGEEKWINARWVGRALKRLNLILDKRRHKSGVEVRLNTKKALEKIQIFSTKEKDG